MMKGVHQAKTGTYTGIAASQGIGIGKAVILESEAFTYESKRTGDVETEQRRYLEAADKLIDQTEELTSEGDVKPEAGIVRAQIPRLRDPELKQVIMNLILEGSSAESAVVSACNAFIELFEASDDEMLKERTADLRDLKERFLYRLTGRKGPDLSDLPEGSVIVAGELTPSMTLRMNGKCVSGIVTECGGSTSHAAILSRAMEIPAVLSVPDITKFVKQGDLLIVDGSEGRVLVRPDESTAEDYSTRKEAYLEKKRLTEKYISLPTLCKDGSPRKVLCNIASPEDTAQVKAFGGEGVGLFRTEYLYMNRNDLPSEEEQTEVYRRVLSTVEGEVIIRTLDIGGDKAAKTLSIPEEANPFLGLRSIRYSLKRKDIFRVQLRALLRSSTEGQLKIMLPMVTCVEEIREVRTMIREEEERLRKEGIAFAEKIPLGIMVETPAAVLMADVLAREADFFSIGTNDLTQYLMSADRGNPEVDHLNSVFQPALIRGISSVIRGAKAAGIPVGMCGEAAAEELLTPLLAGLGLEEFSVNPVSVPLVRARLAQTDPKEAGLLAEKVLCLTSEAEVRDFLKTNSLL